MQTLFPPWDEYQSYQKDLARSSRVDDTSWGWERALNRLLREGGCEPDVARRASESESRRERYRSRIRRLLEPSEADALSLPADDDIDNRRKLRSVLAVLSDADLALFEALAEGYAYEELAEREGVTAGALRTRTSRLRAKLLRAAQA